MYFPEELSEKTKKLFPEEKRLHEAIENSDMASVMGCLREIITPMVNITNDWFMVKMKTSNIMDEDFENNSQWSQTHEFKAARKF